MTFLILFIIALISVVAATMTLMKDLGQNKSKLKSVWKWIKNVLDAFWGMG